MLSWLFPIPYPLIPLLYYPSQVSGSSPLSFLPLTLSCHVKGGGEELKPIQDTLKYRFMTYFFLQSRLSEPQASLSNLRKPATFPE